MSLQLEIELRNKALSAHWDYKYYSRPRPTFPMPWPWVMRNYYEQDLARKRLRARTWLRTPRVKRFRACPKDRRFLRSVQ